MNRIRTVLLIVVVLTVVVVLGVAASQVGGVTIRSASRTHVMTELTTTSDALLPGVPFSVSVVGEAQVGAMAPMLMLRMTQGSVGIREVAVSELQQASFLVTLPCNAVAQPTESTARLVLIDMVSQAVLAQSSQLALLPPGPDCIR